MEGTAQIPVTEFERLRQIEAAMNAGQIRIFVQGHSGEGWGYYSWNWVSYNGKDEILAPAVKATTEAIESRGKAEAAKILIESSLKAAQERLEKYEPKKTDEPAKLYIKSFSDRLHILFTGTI